MRYEINAKGKKNGSDKKLWNQTIRTNLLQSYKFSFNDNVSKLRRQKQAIHAVRRVIFAFEW